jgi:hypothetical protein
VQRQPYLPRFMAGGPQNPLGARAMYLGGTVYCIHGTNDPSTIGGRVSSGCIRLTNEDVTDLYNQRQHRHQGDRAPGRTSCGRYRRYRLQKWPMAPFSIDLGPKHKLPR